MNTQGDLIMRHCRHFYLTCWALLGLIGSLRAAEVRTWTSDDGKSETRAELVKIDAHSVQLKKSNGKLVRVPLSKLSEADRRFVERQRKELPRTTKSSARSTTRIDPELRLAFKLKGYKVTRQGISLIDEAKLLKGLRSSKQAQRKLFQVGRDLAALQRKEYEYKQTIAGLTQKDLALNRELTNVGRTQVNKNNRLVGAINANRSQMRLTHEQAGQLARQLKMVRADANDTREMYIEQLLEMRKLVESIQARYLRATVDKELQEMLTQLTDATGRPYQLDESRSFQSNVKQLKKLEDSVLSEAISLRSTRGGTMYVSVVLDGKYAQEMVLDSGASMISLPPKVAQKCGIEVQPSDPSVILELADGSRITGKLVTIPSVRVGKFTVENVQAAVLGPEAISAEPLLGMTFLGNFKFEVDAQKSTLTMVKVDVDAAR